VISPADFFMAQRRKNTGKAASADRGENPAARADQNPTGRGIAPVDMFGAGRTIVPNPPRKHFAFLVITAVALAGWIAFLLVMARNG
jgi:hypothetical protein